MQNFCGAGVAGKAAGGLTNDMGVNASISNSDLVVVHTPSDSRGNRCGLADSRHAVEDLRRGRFDLCSCR